MSEQISIAQRAVDSSQRLIYVEPNDVYDNDNFKAQGIELTPKYEDFCISFNLIIDAYSRMQKTGINASDANGRLTEKGERQTYCITWESTRKDLQAKRTSLLHGDNSDVGINPETGMPYTNGKYNYLTTYYTDISNSSYGKRTEIEGLGVESVQISYESWYTPTVVIKFVDVRGSALFGREEAIHIDEKLQAENIFGSFFTMPYPLFRLQVKGFLGKPVTFQLTCSNFKGEFNSQTGNFEAVATFIGYSWSLLTDIPFAYLVAAPYATYIGKDYWEKNKLSNPSWQLWNEKGGGTLNPPTLYNLFKDIKASFNERLGEGTDEQRQEIDSIGQESTVLREIKDAIDTFKTKLSGTFANSIEYTQTATETQASKTQILLFDDSNSKLNVLNDEYKKLYAAVKKYADGGFNGTDITIDNLPNGWREEIADNVVFLDRFDIDASNTIIKAKDSNANAIESATSEKLMNVAYNEKNSKLLNGFAEKIADVINNSNNNDRNKVKKYCYLIDFYDLYGAVNSRLDGGENRINKINEDIQNNVNLNIVQLVKCKPYIGNVFKIIFCHLETFCHIMLDSAREIYEQMNNGGRKPNVLGINGAGDEGRSIFPKIDIILDDKNQNITPWPAIFGKQPNEDAIGYDAIENVYGWPGDLTQYRHKFAEVKVVYSIQEGIQMLIEEKEKQSASERLIGFPIIPSDFAKNKFVFGEAVINNVTDLAGYLAIRMTGILGVGCNSTVPDDLAKLFGKLDAYNLYEKLSSISFFTNQTKDITQEQLLNIMLCKEEDATNGYRQSKSDGSLTGFTFENGRKVKTEFNNKDRHPFFKETNSNLEFIFYYDDKDNNIRYVPSKLKAFNQYEDNAGNKDLKYNYENDNFGFTPQYNSVTPINGSHCDIQIDINSRDWMYVTNSSNIGAIKQSLSAYKNEYMFNVIDSKNDVIAIQNKCKELQSGNLKVGDYTITDNLTNFINKFLLVGGNKTSKFFTNKIQGVLSGNIETLGITDRSGFFGQTMSSFDSGEWYHLSNGTNNNDSKCVKIDANGDLSIDGQSTDIPQLVIQSLMVKYNNNDLPFTLFGTPFFYMQNKIDDNDVRLKVKALLFLHTFKYNLHKLNVFSTAKTNATIEEVPQAYVLLIGGLLWRQRYSSGQNSNDPIKYQENQMQYKQCPVNCTFFNNNNDFCIYKNNNDNYKKISEIIGEDVDYNIENQLIKLFENFATSRTFNTILEKCELKDKISNNSQLFPYSAEKFYIDFKAYYDCNTSDVLQQKIINEGGTSGLIGAYSSMVFKYDSGRKNGSAVDYSVLLLLNENDTELQSILKEIYFGTYIITDSCYRRLDKAQNPQAGKIEIPKAKITSYLTGFVEACKAITGQETTSIGEENSLDVSKDVVKNRDLSIAIYYYLKNLWDKWLITANSDDFDVDTFFYNNFVFCDSFYVNTYHSLAVNCEKLLTAWTELADNGSLFHFLSRICTDCGCIFLPVPDYVGFNGEGQEHDIATMNDLFRPMAYNSLPEVSTNNKFIVMFTHSPSHIKDESNNYPYDSYDLFSHDNHGHRQITSVAKELFKNEEASQNDEEGQKKDLVTRYGYNVPSFGVEFARQNNHIFKNLKLSMENPVMTEQAIKAQWNIATKAGNSDHTICFIGQDTFNVFSNYSYSITIEMMGNAQICPLMYFQLMNVPLWRGTYMIYKVVHDMSPGNMTTTITAMKMNKFAQPFNTQFFVIHKVPPKNMLGDGSEASSDCDTIEEAIPIAEGGVVTNPPSVTIDNPDYYNLVLWRYKKTNEYIEGIIYEANTKEILTWTIQNAHYDIINENKGADYIVIGGSRWCQNPNKYHRGCTAYSEKLGIGREGQSGSMLTNTIDGNCLFHPGKDKGWSEGCILIGSKPQNGTRQGQGFDVREFFKENIVTSNNEDVKWYRNFYIKVARQIKNNKKVRLYIVTQSGNVGVSNTQLLSASSSQNSTSHQLVSMKKVLDANGLSNYVEIMPVYAMPDRNFGGRVMPGYKNGQTDLFLGKKAMEHFIKGVKYLQQNHRNYKLVVFDAYRPHSAADNFYGIYKANNHRNPPSGYIAGSNGHSTSRHCKGVAIDVSLKYNNNFVPMTSLPIQCEWARKTGGFDEFTTAANRNNMNTNQNLLRKIMNHGGFISNVSTEWWHFEYGITRDQAAGGNITYEDLIR